MTDTIIIVKPDTTSTTSADVRVPSFKVRSSDIVVSFNIPARDTALNQLKIYAATRHVACNR